jgi:hypothetical protein
VAGEKTTTDADLQLLHIENSRRSECKAETSYEQQEKQKETSEDGVAQPTVSFIHKILICLRECQTNASRPFV